MAVEQPNFPCLSSEPDMLEEEEDGGSYVRPMTGGAMGEGSLGQVTLSSRWLSCTSASPHLSP